MKEALTYHEAKTCTKTNEIRPDKSIKGFKPDNMKRKTIYRGKEWICILPLMSYSLRLIRPKYFKSFIGIDIYQLDNTIAKVSLLVKENFMDKARFSQNQLS
jgi:hypothetical protein